MSESTPKKRTGNKPIKNHTTVAVKLTPEETEFLNWIAADRGLIWGGSLSRSHAIRALIKDAIRSRSGTSQEQSEP